MYKTADNVALMLNVNAGRPLQAQLFEQVRAMIIDGQLTSGTPLPATRALSEQLGVSRNTVVLAYDRLLSEGYIESKRSIGTFVSDAIPETGLKPTPVSDEALQDSDVNGAHGAKTHAPLTDMDLTSLDGFQSSLEKDTFEDNQEQSGPAHLLSSDRLSSVSSVAQRLHAPIIDFLPGLPDIEAFPTRTWRRLLTHTVNRHEDIYEESHDPLGFFDLRRAIAEHLGPARGIIAQADDIVVFSSVQEARGLLAQLLLTDGAPAIMETPGPERIASLFSHYKTNVYGITVDEDGLQTDDLPTIDKGALRAIDLPNIQTTRPSHISYGMAYVTPSHQFPLGVSLSLSRRVHLLEWARRTGIMIVEDETTSDFRYGGSPLTALKGLDNRISSGEAGGEPARASADGSVIYLGGFKKSLGIEIGYLVAPSFLTPTLRFLKSVAFGSASFIEQAALAEFIDNGAYDRHLRKLRKKCKEKRDLLISLLTNHFGDGISLSSIEGGLHLIWHLPKEFGPALDLTKDMLNKHKIGLYGLDSGGALVAQGEKFDQQALVFGYASLSLEDIESGVNQLVAELKSRQKNETA